MSPAEEMEAARQQAADALAAANEAAADLHTYLSEHEED